MSNNNMPIGIQPINDNGTPWSGQGRLVCFAAALNTNVFIGDPLVATGATDAYGVPEVELATAGTSNPILGSFVRRSNGPNGGANASTTLLQSDHIYVPSGSLAYGLICDDPNVLYAVQEDSVTAAITAAAAGYINANLQAGSGGSTATGLSSWQLVSSSVGTATTLQVKIIGLLRAPDNAIGTYAKWMVRLNLAQLWSLTGA